MEVEPGGRRMRAKERPFCIPLSRPAISERPTSAANSRVRGAISISPSIASSTSSTSRRDASGRSSANRLSMLHFRWTGGASPPLGYQPRIQHNPQQLGRPNCSAEIGRCPNMSRRQPCCTSIHARPSRIAQTLPIRRAYCATVMSSSFIATALIPAPLATATM